jgi:hypothetical protein
VVLYESSSAGHAQLYLPHVTDNGDEAVYEVVKVSGGARRTWFIGDDDIQCEGS